MGDYKLYKIGKFLAMHLPLKGAYAVAVFLADLHFLFSKSDRRNVIANLSVIFPDGKSNVGLARAVFHNFAKYLVDFFRVEKLNKQTIGRSLKIENIEAIDRAFDQKKGVIVLTAHLGNWELGGIIMPLLGYPFYGIALPHKDERVNNFFNKQREIFGERVIPLGRAARMCIECLEKNAIIALLGDRDFTPGGIVIDFFSRKALIPKGPAAFSLKMGSPIVPGFVVRQNDDTFKLIFEEPIIPPSSSNTDQDIVNLTEKFLKVIESYIRQYPDQWLMFRNFWIK